MTTTEPGSAAPIAATDRPQRPDSILIYGQQKTGTTGMYNTVKRALAPVSSDYLFLFEPETASQVRSIRRRDPRLAIMAKVIAHRTGRGFPIDTFERRVMMFRDPRDTLISNLLFKPLTRATVGLSMKRHDRFLDALEHKEHDPASISVTELIELCSSLGYRHASDQRLRKMQERVIRIGREHGFHHLSYERFVDGDLGEISDYLGLDLHVIQPGGGTWLDHISRSREYGAWRHWFTPADVDHYRAMYGDFLDHFGYGDDWELADPQVIDPATSSEHVRASLAKRRAELAVDGSHGSRGGVGFDLNTQYTMADDGSATAALAVAEHLLAVDRGYLLSARHWARRAELLGSAEGKALRVDIDSRRRAAHRRAAEGRATGQTPVEHIPMPPPSESRRDSANRPGALSGLRARCRQLVSAAGSALRRRH